MTLDMDKLTRDAGFDMSFERYMSNGFTGDGGGMK